ncbi:hypothetical protein [Streptomyces sp. NRRL F-5123]|uniref:hypothetical protein n=1 Tax=Streptomyces sp. NRRL F-5123 TaxID=1463856 RepID=UPI0004E14C41|nr:hypothetical protein [Streptomyces sp. NRRL F-5123]
MLPVRRLGRRALLRRGDLVAGIAGTSEDPADPWAHLALRDKGTDTRADPTVRPGETVRVGRYTLTVAEVVPGSRDGYVTFTVDGPEDGDAAPR